MAARKQSANVLSRAEPFILDAVARAAARSKDPSTQAIGKAVRKESAEIEAELQALADLPPIEFERRRKDEAERLGVRKSTLDTEVQKRRGMSSGADLDPAHWKVEPWPDPVDGAALADEMVAIFTRHLVLVEHAAEAMALWVLHAWCLDAADVSPILAFVSPTKRCGKTNALTIMNWLCPRSEPASSITASVLYRFVELSCPTLIVDELDNQIEDNKDLLAVLNGGHKRSMASVLRSVGDGKDFIPKRFSAWSPKIVGTIKILPGTMADRSIVIPMRRKRRDEPRARVNSNDTETYQRLRSQCLRWMNDHLAELRDANPVLSETLDDRAIDNWRPLKAIADALGPVWSQRAWNASVELSRDRGDDASNGEALLEALRDIFDEHGQTIYDQGGNPEGKALHTETIVSKLHEADSRWKEYGRPGSEKPITGNSVSRLLSQFKIKSANVTINTVQKKGYRESDFADAFARYPRI